MAKTLHRAKAYFQTSDNADGTFSVWAYDPHGEKITLGNCPDIMISLDLDPAMTMQQADEIADALRKHVKYIRLQCV
jgi:hypothetical protein